MGHRQFDAAVRALRQHGGATRRHGILAALAIIFGGGAGVSLARGRNGGHPGSEGPCKGLKRPDNICKRDRDCCTEVCNLDAGRANDDGLGRCRCKRAGESCTADRNCCRRGARPLACVSGVCGSSGPAGSCDGGNCADGCCRGSRCVPFAGQNDGLCGMLGMTCAACNAGSRCVNGGCFAPTPTPPPTPPPPASCGVGNCAAGCCNGSTCVPYASQDATTCGTNGAACVACQTGDPICNNDGTCQ